MIYPVLFISSPPMHRKGTAVVATASSHYFANSHTTSRHHSILHKRPQKQPLRDTVRRCRNTSPKRALSDLYSKRQSGERNDKQAQYPSTTIKTAITPNPISPRKECARLQVEYVSVNGLSPTLSLLPGSDLKDCRLHLESTRDLWGGDG